ncbi:MAG: carbohydrate ABC transporter permease [Planctomycetota bacterium]
MSQESSRTSRRPRRLSARTAGRGYLFILPWMIGFLIFTAGPMIASIFLSLTKYNLAEIRFIGLENYRSLVAEDPLFWKSLLNTTIYVAVSVPLGLTGSLLLALMLSARIKGVSIFRTIYYLPSITPAVASALLWMWVFHPDIGILNHALRALGFANPPGWLQSEQWALPAFIVMSLWGIGGARMIIFLAGIQNVSDHYYDAAKIDGANAFQRFIHITIPLITPVIFFNLVLGVIGAFQVFASAYVMTNGGPNNATLFYALYLYRTAFQFFKMGRASAMAWMLFAILLVFTYFQFRNSRRWVHYEGGLT